MSEKPIVLMGQALGVAVVLLLACVGAYSIVQPKLESGRFRLEREAALKADSGPKLTAEDRLEIQELLNRYMFILDSCPDHNNGYEYADLYTEDGQFGTMKGREALAAAAGRTSDGGCKEIRRRGAMNQIHINVAPII